jgi:hypothetical protein
VLAVADALLRAWIDDDRKEAGSQMRDASG